MQGAVCGRMCCVVGWVGWCGVVWGAKCDGWGMRWVVGLVGWGGVVRVVSWGGCSVVWLVCDLNYRVWGEGEGELGGAVWGPVQHSHTVGMGPCCSLMIGMCL